MKRAKSSLVPKGGVPLGWTIFTVALLAIVVTGVSTYESVAERMRPSMNGRSVTVSEGSDPDVDGRAVIIKRTDSSNYVVFSVNEIGAVVRDFEEIRKRHPGS